MNSQKLSASKGICFERNMSKPPRHPRFTESPTQSFSSVISGSSVSTDVEEDAGGSSILLRELYESFEPVEAFSQFESREGRGRNVIMQTIGLLHHIWSNRDKTFPERCFDRHDGRNGLKLYSGPKREIGGVVIPCALITDKEPMRWQGNDINIVNHNVTIRSSDVQPVDSMMNDAVELDTRNGTSNSGKIQMTFRRPAKKLRAASSPSRTRNNKGKFQKKNIVPVRDIRGEAPCIPMRVKGLRRLLKQFVLGDRERYLNIPLSEFSLAQRNGRDCNGKLNKQIYSRRRKVALATLIALQDAVENNISLAAALGIHEREKDLNKLRMMDWERIAGDFLQTSTRSMGDQELIELGRKMYCEKYLALLPSGNE